MSCKKLHGVKAQKAINLKNRKVDSNPNIKKEDLRSTPSQKIQKCRKSNVFSCEREDTNNST